MSQKLTDWFPADVKPMRVGVYECKRSAYSVLKHWNGVWFGAWGVSADDAYDRKEQKSVSQDEEWRGLAQPPKGKK